jgi:hypothetical protein
MGCRGNTHHRHDGNWPSHRDALTDEPQYRRPSTAAMGTSWLASPSTHINQEGIYIEVRLEKSCASDENMAMVYVGAM